MIVFLNGQFVPEEQACVSVFDRGFLYGDGLFETMRVYAGRPFRWTPHLERLQRGAEYLRLRLPFTPEELSAHAAELIRQNAMPESVLRITLTRGVGPRGYSPQYAEHPFLVMDLRPAQTVDPVNPPRWRVVVASFCVPANDPLATFKTANKLHQVLARAEADAHGADEALLLNSNGDVAEAAASNVFWVEGGTVYTTPLASSALPGVTRALVMELCQSLALPWVEKNIKPDALRSADGVFLTLSTLGIVEMISLDGADLRQSPLVGQLQHVYREEVANETAG